MPKYEVEFTRVENGFVTLDAANEAEACEKTYDAYCAGQTIWGDEEIKNMKAKEIKK